MDGCMLTNKSPRVKKNKYCAVLRTRFTVLPLYRPYLLFKYYAPSTHVKGKRFTNAVLHYIHYITYTHPDITVLVDWA